MVRVMITGLAGASLVALTAPTPAQAGYGGRCVAGRGLERSLSDLLGRLRASDGTPGISASVFDQNGVVASAAVGQRSSNGTDKVGINDSFALASNTKHLLAVNVAQLVDQGRLSYGASIADLMPDMAAGMRPEYRDVTVRQLLTMSAGMPLYNDGGDAGTQAFFDYTQGLKGSPIEQRRQAAEYILAQEPLYEPGRYSAYSNANYVVLGAILEKVTGERLEKTIIDGTFGKVGATAGWGIPRDFGSANPSLHIPQADGSVLVVDRPEDATDVFRGRMPVSTVSAGGMVATMPAFAKVETQLLRAAMGLDQTLASSGALRGLFTPTLDYGDGAILTSDILGETSHYFIGNTAGSSAYSFLLPGSGVGLVLATNMGTEAIPNLAGTEAATYRLLASLARRAKLGVPVARSADQAAIFNAVEALCGEAGGGSSPIVAAFGELTADQASALGEAIAPDDARALDQLASAPLEGMADQLAIQMAPGARALRGRVQQTGSGWRAFLAGGDIDGRVALDNAGTGTDMRGWQTTAGFDRQLSPHWKLGAAYGFARNRAAVSSGNTKLRSHQIGLNLAYDGGTGLFADLRTVLAWQHATTQRTLGGFGTAAATRNLRGTLIDADIGYAVGGALRIAPIAGVRYQSIHVGAAKESGSIFALSLDSRTARRLDARFGASVAGDFDLGGLAIRPSLEALHVRTLTARNPEVLARFVEGGPGISFTPGSLDRRWTELRGAVALAGGPLGVQLGVTETFGRFGRNSLRWTASTSVAF